eukprot:sb/3466252/
MSSDESDDYDHVVFELGSWKTRAGIAGEDVPSVVRPTCVPDSNSNLESTELDYTKCFSADKFEHLLRMCYDELPVKDPAERGVILIEPLSVSNASRELAIQILMETFQVPSYYSASSPHMSLYASGRGSGTIMQCGHAATETVSIYEGYLVPGSQMSYPDNSGRKVTSLVKELLRKGLSGTHYDYDVCTKVKEEHFSLLHEEFNDFSLPDGRLVNVTPQIKSDFTNSIFGGDHGIAKMAYHAVMAADMDMRRDLFCNLILSGGASLVKGFKDSFLQEIRKESNARHTDKLRINATTAPEREFNSWIGGSIVGSLSCYQGAHISKEMYEEVGPSIIHKYCPYGNVEMGD